MPPPSKRCTTKFLGPMALIWFSTELRKPPMAEAIPTTVVTPITTPRMVSTARTLLERSASSAISTPSRADVQFIASPLLLRPQGDDGVQPRGAVRGIHSGHQADTDSQGE